MNTFKAKVNKIILGLTSVGLLILLIFPGSLSAHHFRYGTMSWKQTGNAREIEVFMQIGWTANHGDFRRENDYDPFVSGYIGSIKGGDGDGSGDYFYEIEWGDSSTTGKMDHKIISREGGDWKPSVSADSGDCSASQCTKNTLSNMGVYDDSVSPKWKKGMTHTYSSDGNYTIYWTSSSRATVENSNGTNWRNQTKVNIGGAYAGNNSPVGAVPYVVQVQDNTTFRYQVSALDPDGDALGYRWGTKAEFFNDSGDFVMPTGMTLSPSGLIEWDVRNSVLSDGDGGEEGDLWVSVIMVEDSTSSGDNKSYIPLDFFFKLASADNDPPAFSVFPTGTQTVVIGDNKTFTIKSTDDRGEPPIVSVLNPPSADNKSMWDNVSSISVDNETTFTIHFAPNSTQDNDTYAVNIRSTDNDSMTYDKTLAIRVTSVSNANPTAPILISPADGDNVTSPVAFQFAGSTDPDGDTVSYTMYICDDPGLFGSGDCSGTSVTAGGNFVLPFNQNFHDNLIPWPSPLYAATSSQQISQDISMIPKWFIMLVMLGLLSVIISLSVKNIKHRRIVFMLFLIIIGTAVSCMKSSDSSSSDNSTSSSDTTTPNTTAPTVSSVSTTADNQSSVAVTDNITVTFSEAMDTTFVTTSTSNTNCAGTIRVSSDNFNSCVKMSSAPASSNSDKTFTLDPYGYLTVLTTYLTRVTTGVKNTAGNAMSSQYDNSTGFTTDNISTAKLTVSNSYTSGTTWYWKVEASDPKGGTAESETWSFSVQ